MSILKKVELAAHIRTIVKRYYVQRAAGEKLERADGTQSALFTMGDGVDRKITVVVSSEA